MKGFLALSWIEFKIFMREPMGSVSALIFPVVIFAVLSSGGDGGGSRFESLLVPVPIFAVVLIGMSNAKNGEMPSVRFSNALDALHRRRLPRAIGPQ